MPTDNEEVDDGQREPLDRRTASPRPHAESDDPPGITPAAQRPTDPDEHPTGEAQAARNRADESPV